MCLNKQVFYLYFLLFASWHLYSAPLHCANDSVNRNKNILKTDLLMPTLSFIDGINMGSLTYERLVKKRLSIQLTTLFYNTIYNHTDNSHYETEIITGKNFGFMIIPEFKFYVSKKRRYSGYYIGISAAVIQSKVTEHHKITTSPGYLSIYGTTNEFDVKNIYNEVGAGFINGYQFNVSKNIVFDFIGGMGISTIVSHFGPTYVSSFNDLYWRLALNIGYKF